MSTILRFLTYKLERSGGQVIRAPKFYPSTKRCSDCGLVKPEMRLSERVFRCERCKLVIDRDLNASKNLEQLGTMFLLLGALRSLGLVSEASYDWATQSWLTKSGSVGSTTQTARGAKKVQGASPVLRDEPRSRAETPRGTVRPVRRPGCRTGKSVAA